MNSDEHEDNRVYKVVVNHEEQYSIWPADRENPWAGMTLAKLDPKLSVWNTLRKFGQKPCVYVAYIVLECSAQADRDKGRRFAENI